VLNAWLGHLVLKVLLTNEKLRSYERDRHVNRRPYNPPDAPCTGMRLMASMLQRGECMRARHLLFEAPLRIYSSSLS